MKNENCKKIREVFFAAIDNYRDANDIPNISDIIFTSFDFSPLFFENNIITKLAGEDKISNLQEINNCDELLKKINVSVYYDAGYLIDYEKRLSYDTFAVNEKKLFHPKIIFIKGTINGETRSHLLVMSANLTVSGWGRNAETVACVEIDDSRIASKLAIFFEKLFENSKNGVPAKSEAHNKEIINYLRSFKNTGNSGVEFFSTYSDNISLAEYISGKHVKNMTVISPFYNSNLNEFITKNFIGIKLRIIPAVSNQKIGIKRAEFEKIKENIEFKTLDIAADRFAHGKAYITDKFFIIGSHNFTREGIGILKTDENEHTRNIEAALIFEKTKFSVESQNIDTAYFLDENETWDKEFEANEQKIYCRVDMDWNKFIYRVWTEGEIENCYIELPGMEKKALKEGLLEISFSAGTIKNSAKIKVFDIFGPSGLIFKGLINEIEWQFHRPEPECSSLDECLECWTCDDYEQTNKKMAEYAGNGSADSELIARCSTINYHKDVFDNYFYLFKSFRKMKLKIEEKKDNINELYRIFKTSPASVCVIISKFNETGTNGGKSSGPYRWIFYNELILVLEKIKEISVRNSECDEKFISELNETAKELIKQISAFNPIEDKLTTEWAKKELGYTK